MDDRYKETFNTWNKVAKLYEDKFMDLDLYNDSYDIFCNAILTKSPNILEIGCGPGNITKYIQSQRPLFDILGIDIAPKMVELAKKNNPLAKFKVMDARDIGSLSAQFDAIICGFCLPYLSNNDRLNLILDCKKLLSQNGILYISFVEGDYDKSHFQTGSSSKDRVYFYYHELENLKLELEQNDFQILNILNADYPRGEKIEKHTILIAGRMI